MVARHRPQGHRWRIPCLAGQGIYQRHPLFGAISIIYTDPHQYKEAHAPIINSIQTSTHTDITKFHNIPQPPVWADDAMEHPTPAPCRGRFIVPTADVSALPTPLYNKPIHSQNNTEHFPPYSPENSEHRENSSIPKTSPSGLLPILLKLPSIDQSALLKSSDTITAKPQRKEEIPCKANS
jgi:hypothetical protein